MPRSSDGLRVVVVGATGNVGTSVVRELGRDPAVGSIVGIARRRPRWHPPKTTWVSADIGSDPGVDFVAHFRGADAVVHLAWLLQPSRDPLVTWRTNVLGSYKVFAAVAAAGVSTLVHASSVGAYSPGPKNRTVDESWPTHGWPEASYCREKSYLERALDTYELHHPGIRVVRMRPAFLFKKESATEQCRLFAGPLVPGRLVRPGLLPVVPDLPGLVFQALHTDDAARAYRLAVTRPVQGAFNLAADPPVTADVLAELLAARPVRLPARPVRAALTAAWLLRAVPTSPYLFDAVLRLPLMDTGRARDELGWQPEHSSVEALRDLLAGLRESAAVDTPPLVAGPRY
ncbi:NAD-dependent epimerase/dehydratase family protein [Streptomyces sp. LX-29]|uniref:NAD-dependent epimerase/dehydratase family protein n=1 Tax=Streptomyces sp. LX-29 TaxID=2900152 RepID=UPI00240E82A5|nr:NAD-dependent epimerase/dehydratase family protein [Streptomyces sp. LX-29]WFB06069.1 NAD-dependent epimerase/dehydratase family protein [Streptomyces sp. LX-29]